MLLLLFLNWLEIEIGVCFVFDFWVTGIMFQDITTLLLDHKAFKDTVDIFVDRYRGMNISVVAGIFLFFFFISLLS